MYVCVCAFGVLRFGTERLYAQKEDLLHEVLELEAEKGLLASGEGTKYQVSVRCVVSAEESGNLKRNNIYFFFFYKGCFYAL